MTIQQVVDRILARHSFIENYDGCDGYKSGNPESPCTGVVTAMSATTEVGRKAMDPHANLILVHEPTNHTSTCTGTSSKESSPVC